MRAKVILGILLLNTITFVIARVWWLWHDNLAAEPEAHINNPTDPTMTYLIAGNLNQASLAFEFMEPYFGNNYTFMQFSPRGWSAKATADQIALDICKNGYRARIFTISLGDHVARYLEKELGNSVEVYAINPCPNQGVLQKTWRQVLWWAAPLAEIAMHGLGWLSYLPVLPSWGGSYSLALLVDQYWCIYYDRPPLRTSRTYGVVCSTEDRFLDNATIEKLYPDAEIEYVNTGHSDIVENSCLYYQAIRTLLTDNAAP